MLTIDNFIRLFENATRECWDRPALSDFHKSTITYRELAERVYKLDLIWKKAGIKPGDKIAINTKSCALGASVFMAAVSKGYVAVHLYNAFTPADTQRLVNHSDSKILYTEKRAFDEMNFDEMPQVLCVIDAGTGKVLASRNGVDELYAQADALLAADFPGGMQPADFKVCNPDLDDVCAILYTSGSTGNPKGVMLSVRNFSVNVFLIPRHFPYREGQTYLSVLPFAHIFGMMYDAIEPLCLGMHLTILGLPPVPAYLKPALNEVKPNVFFAVPLILVKMLDNTIGEFVTSKSGRQKLADHKNNQDYCKALNTIFMSAFGENIELLVTGGAAMAFDLEDLMAQKLQIPFVTGYGMTEACPTIAIGEKGKYKMKSVGEIVAEGIARSLRPPKATPSAPESGPACS